MQASRMEQVSFAEVTTPEDIRRVADLARQIWMEHFVPIIGEAQTVYMIERFQSTAAVTRQIAAEWYRYYLIMTSAAPAGYFAVQPQGDTLFLSKLYVDLPCRRKGIARQAVAFLEGICRRDGFSRIRLTVNKRNFSSISAHDRLGFVRVEDIVTDIGEGFVMDDYGMEYIPTPC